jgi:uncharacterized protein (TIGR02145 family)
MKFMLKITLVLAGLVAAELPLKVRADQALSQLEANIQANNFAGALPWLEKAVALESEGYTLPSGMGFFAGQVYAKNGVKAKAVPFLEAYVNQPAPGKYFWEAVQLLCQASPSKGKAYLETYLAKDNPPYYQQALALYTQVEPAAKLEESLLSKMGTLADSRDGKTYQTIQIGSQVWMAENLNYSTGNSWCYDNNSSNCTKWGRLYDWQTAKSACPSGWHLPSNEEWRPLDALPAKNLVSLSWYGTNATGFDALPGGYRYTDGSFSYAGNCPVFWSASDGNAKYAWCRSLDAGYETLGRFYKISERYGFSVRCLKD